MIIRLGNRGIAHVGAVVNHAHPVRAGELLTPRRATPALALVLAGVLVLAALGVMTR